MVEFKGLEVVTSQEIGTADISASAECCEAMNEIDLIIHSSTAIGAIVLKLIELGYNQEKAQEIMADAYELYIDEFEDGAYEVVE